MKSRHITGSVCVAVSDTPWVRCAAQNGLKPTRSGDEAAKP